MMKTQKQRRRRGVILTRSGFKKLQDATTQAQIQDNQGYRYTLEALGERTGLDPDTVFKVYTGKTGVDKRTLIRCFKAFNLKLELVDYCGVEGTLPRVETPHKYQFLGYQDWGAAPDVSRFYGRQAELTTLTHWIEEARCRIITLLGMKGVGTTSVGVKLAQQLQHQFDYVIWRSLRSGHSLGDFLRDLLQCFSLEQLPNSSEDISHLISRLLQSLREYRCLVILDDVDSILSAYDLPLNSRGNYPQDDPYGELFKRLGETSHQSCLLLMGHCKPKEIKLLEGDCLPVRVLYLKGLEFQDAVAILKDKGCRCSNSLEQWSQIIRFYGGNPLFLKLLATTIQNLFDGMTSDFLAHNSPIFGEIRVILNQQFEALNVSQKRILTHLAITAQPVCFSQLREQLVPSLPPPFLLESLENLKERSLIEQTHGFFFLPPFLKVYLIDKIIESPLSDISLKTWSCPSHLQLAFAAS